MPQRPSACPPQTPIKEPDPCWFAGQHHLHHLRGVRVGIAQSADELAFNPQFAQHLADFGAAAVDQNHADAGKRQQDDIAHHGFFQFRIDHGVPAVFDHDDFPGVFLNIRQRGGEYLRLHVDGKRLIHLDIRSFIRGLRKGRFVQTPSSKK